jgi:hypothetical protein
LSSAGRLHIQLNKETRGRKIEVNKKKNKFIESAKIENKQIWISREGEASACHSNPRATSCLHEKWGGGREEEKASLGRSMGPKLDENKLSLNGRCISLSFALYTKLDANKWV